ncbi:MAG: peptide ABC transporter substrate-binding protein [Clostridia bacterium]|nr:peptide ABC transporter substrate-binding protein [Clostridia bacterium]
MKKLVSIVLMCLMLLGVLSGCAVDSEDKGAIIPVSISKEMKAYDPVPMIYDAELVMNTGVLYEGLTVVNENGKIEKGLAEDWYTKIDEERGEYWLYFEIEEGTSWDDERYVQADDFVYAWRRILSPSTSSPAACLLYGIKNAKAYKAGDVTADDLGVYAESDSLLKVEFEGPFDLDLFLEAVSSPALVAQREDNVAGREDSWAASLDHYAANGAFTIKNLEMGESVTFQRNAVYGREKTSDTAVYKVVKPWKLTQDFTLSIEENIEKFNNGEIYYISRFDKETYDAYEKKIDTQDLLSVYSYFFNTTKAPFDNQLVRQALSVALDREEIAELSLGGKPATGLVTYGVHDTKTSKSFRKVGKDLIDTNANLEKAKDLIKQAGIKASDYTINIYTLRDEADVAIAEYTKEVWEGLGFKVKLSSGGGRNYTNKLYLGDFDVIGIDYQGLTTDAFSFLAPFAKEYSGEAIDITAEERTATHVTGFDNEEYNALIDKAFNTLDNKERVSLLHDAEEMLIDLCPVAPLHFNVNSYMKSKKLSNLEFSGYGFTIFTEAKLKNYEESNAVIIAEEEARKKAEIEANKNKNK